MKETKGLGWTSKFYTNKLLSIHLDINKFRKNKKDPLYQFLVKSANKISFPMVDFLNAWKVIYHLEKVDFIPLKKITSNLKWMKISI